MAMELRRQGTAQRVARALFQMHVSVYALVNLFLMTIWLLTGAGSFWPIWTIVPWGFALAVHGWATWGLPALLRK